jgi:pyridoxine kinase
MRALTRHADILTPNLTEACILAGLPYQERFTEKELTALCQTLSDEGPTQIVISGLPLDENTLGNFVFERGQPPVLLPVEKIGCCRSGTGDVFSSIITGGVVQGLSFRAAVRLASDFIAKTIRRTIELNIPVTDGICFEEYLTDLSPRKAAP